ncbi:type II toxin-antitoxin system HipA family toxin [Herbiconiux sp. 11R-BC]|uniref:type II toxin-antitoxin system HipA family toxin n=1 Tax=Herbiconiux sp. 11R-BC TaxID=3111637 RepID=UPI003C07DB60
MTAIFTFLSEGDGTARVGTAYTTARRSVLTASFAYERDYLARPSAYALDPALPLSGGTATQGLPRQGLPGAFSDAAPDRWGRNLISKRLRAEAAADGRTAPAVTEVDYLLGVSDETRQGALRFAREQNGEFLRAEHDVPKLIALPQLMRAAEKVVADDPEEMSAVKLLLDAGTGSLGGARPKASVKDGHRLLIAKFAHPDDEWSVIAWEKTALDLAADAGIDVPRTELVHVDGKPVLLLDRFDREGAERVGYISAMTLVQSSDGEARDYVEIAEALAADGASVAADLEQLWRRIAFSIAIHNTDDHLRNHGFLRRSSGWVLSPAFDVNPNPTLSASRVTSIGGSSDLKTDVTGLFSYAPTFGLTARRARAIAQEVADAARAYRGAAVRNSVPEGELARFAPTLEAATGALVASAPG